MKLKGLTKLVLAGTALAATAATLTTSTYAWYVTNSEAKVDGIQGTAKAGGLGNILIAQAASGDSAVDGHGAFMQNLTLDIDNLITDKTSGEGSANPNGHLLPSSPQTVAYSPSADTAVQDKTYYTRSGENEPYTYTKVTNPTGNPSTSSYYERSTTPATVINSSTKWYDAEANEMTHGRYITFDLWILSTDKDTVRFNYDIVNTSLATDVKKQLAHSANGAPVAQGTEFAVDIVEALRLSYTTKTVTKTGTPATYSTASDFTTTAFDVSSTARNKSVATDGLTFDALTNTTNANTYYSAVLGHAPEIATGVSCTGVTAQTFLVKPNEAMKLSFYLWLEGPDNACFDSCAGQKFSIEFLFEAINS